MRTALKSALTVLFLMTSMLLPKTSFAQSEADHKIVFQLVTNDAKAQKGLLKQLNNLKNGYGDSVIMEVVCHGPGLDLLHEERSAHKEALLKLKDRGVIFLACENTLKGRNIPKEAIMKEFNFVPMGIGHIIERQENGWSYIKAGL